MGKTQIQKVIILNVQNISKDFPSVRALGNVSFNLEAGEIYVLVGESGAGKSTLEKIISGIVPEYKGTIEICGKEVRKNYPNITQNLGISLVFQELGIIPSLTIAQYLFLAHETLKSHIIVKKREILYKSKELLNDLEINIDVATKYSVSVKALQCDFNMR